MPSLTDLALGLVTLYLVRRLPRGGEVSRHWRTAFAWAAGTALAGAVYHGVFVGIPRVNHLSWAVMSSMVVVVVSYLLAASVVHVLGRSRARVFWLLRSVGLVAYVVLAATGHASITAIMWCESLTMASVLGLWIWAWLRHHPMGRPMLVAIGASIAAAMLRLVPGAADVRLAGLPELALAWRGWDTFLSGAVLGLCYGALTGATMIVLRRASRHTLIPLVQP
jgi:hypothetical protein